MNMLLDSNEDLSNQTKVILDSGFLNSDEKKAQSAPLFWDLQSFSDCMEREVRRYPHSIREEV